MAITYDSQTIDSTGAFLVGELERLDQELHLPLALTTWHRDIDLREDVTIADEASAYTNTSLAAMGGVNPNGKNWIGSKSSEVATIHVNINKTTHPMTLWGMGLEYTIVELAKAQQLGRPVDTQKHEGIKLKHGMDVDEQVYIGDADLGCTGLVNSAGVPVHVVNQEWTDATPAKTLLNDVNAIIHAAWKNSGYAICPDRLLMSPAKFALLMQPVTEAGSESIYEYVARKCLCMANNGRPLDIKPSKWLTGRGAGKKDRVVAYTKNKQFVRFPMVPLQRTPLEHRGLSQLITYFGTLGEVELVYPETLAYADGL